MKVLHISVSLKNPKINPFADNFTISNSLKTQENIWFSGVFMGYKLRTLAKNWVEPMELYILPNNFDQIW